MPGSVASGFHEGSRSEYLAQYVFTMLGTVTPVPHQEDSGIDLYCTLTEDVGRRAFPVAYFSVQVKSASGPWVFKDADEIRWFIDHPLPLFLCVVDKRSLQLRVYHTTPRFHLWASAAKPARLELTVEDGQSGRNTQYEGDDEHFSLSAPIWSATLLELQSAETQRAFGEVMLAWIEVEVANLHRMRSGVNLYSMPAKYTTNDPNILKGGQVFQGTIRVPDLTLATKNVGECVNSLAGHLYRKDDLPGAARCALLLRHLFPEDTSMNWDTYPLQDTINRVTDSSGYVFAGVDSLSRLIDAQLKGAPKRIQITVDRYQKMGTSGVLTSDDHAELIEGDIVRKSPISPRHASLISQLSKQLILAIPESASVRVGNPLDLGKSSELVPDLMILKSKPDDYMQAHPRAEDLLLLVEVADASLDFDLGLNRDIYAKYDVCEYWIVDAIHERVLRHRQPVHGAFQQTDEHGMGDTISPQAFPAIQVPVRELFGKPAG